MTDDALALGRPIRLDCSYPDEHGDAHHEHPKTGRLVCLICHPPAYLLREWAERRESGPSAV